MKLIKLFVFLLSVLLNSFCFGKSHQPISDSLSFIEKVYLHVDRNSYFAGEDVWFKAYLISAFNHALTNHSNNLHVELISPASKIISYRTIRLEDGLGNGDFKLPNDISSGRYKIRAYTNYMRNFTDQLFFNKEIIILNSTDSAKITDQVKYVENKIQLSFFPEGGSMVDNVSSIVAFKAINSFGKGCDVIGKIYSSNGDLITTFRSTHLGMGKFFIRPLPGLKYYSIFKGSDSIDIKADLPTSFLAGVVLNTTINQNNELLFTTKTNPETLALISDHNLLLSFSIRNEVLKTISYKIQFPVSSFVIPTDDLPDGILKVTLISTEGLPLSESLIYFQKEDPIKIQIETDKQLYCKRDPVSLKISISGDSTIRGECNISLAVVNENLTDKTSLSPRNISSWFLLESEVRGVVEEPSYYFDLSNPSRFGDLDLLLRTQGWRDFAWKYDTLYYPPENGFTISGRLTKLYKNKPIEGSRVSIGIFGTNKNILTTIPVDSNGKFKLSGIDLIGEARIIASGIDQKDRMKGTLILDSVAYNPAKVLDCLSIISTSVNFNQSKLRSYYIIDEAIRKKYKLYDTISIGEVNIISERHKDPQTIKVESSRRMYEKPDAELIVTESMGGYQNVPELIRGKIAGVEVIYRDGKYSISVRGISSITANKPPLILIDGNQASFDDLIIMPVSNIERIDVLKQVSSTVIFGLEATNGVINIITKAGGEPAIYKPVDYSAKLQISGYSASRIFYSPQHVPNSDSDPKPDLRSTLYWRHDIRLVDSNNVILKYYNGDKASLIKIIAEGITTTGIPVTGKAEYEIR
jgi:hypothetical protein